jgi:hypothetical protein
MPAFKKGGPWIEEEPYPLAAIGELSPQMHPPTFPPLIALGN